MFAILNEFAILRELRDKFMGKLRGHRSIYHCISHIYHVNVYGSCPDE